ncbi:MAG TPA: hypothetical protein VJV79_08085 [Polyangiaceae bacterium]|nr:hypothetical protein [Polyangiaceae bacterium]
MLSLAARRTALAGLAAFAGALALFFGVGGLRLWPRISGQHLPLSLIWPFARPLLAVALEVSFLVSVPVALGIAASLRSARGAEQVSWRATAWATCSLVLVLGAFSFGVSYLLDGRGTSPGQLATELVASARESCIESAPPAEVSVPMLGFAWVCEAGRAPQLQGRAPLGKQATFRASAITLGEDLKRIALDGFTLAFPLAAFKIDVQVHAKQATLSGLPPWGRSRRIPLALRICLFSLSAGLSGYGIGRLASLRPWLPAWAGALLGACASACLWWAMAWLERQEPHPASYLALPAAGIAGAALAGLALHAVQRVRWRPGRRASSSVGP